jgi:hypothetical protein
VSNYNKKSNTIYAVSTENNKSHNPRFSAAFHDCSKCKAKNGCDTSQITLTAVYTAGGEDVTGLPNSDLLTDHAVYTISSKVPQRPHHVFEGWAASFGSTYQPGQSFMISGSSVVLIAQWRPANTA